MKTFKNYVSTIDEERLNDYFLNENESEEINEGLLGWFINKFKVGEGTKKVIKGLGKAGVKFAEYQATLEKIRSGKSDDKIGKTIGDELKETGKIEDPKELLERHMKMIKDNEDDFKKSPCGVALAMTAFELACAVKDNDAKDYLTKFIKDSSNDAKKEVKDTAGKVSEEGKGEDKKEDKVENPIETVVDEKPKETKEVMDFVNIDKKTLQKIRNKLNGYIDANKDDKDKEALIGFLTDTKNDVYKSIFTMLAGWEAVKKNADDNTKVLKQFLDEYEDAKEVEPKK